MRSTHPPRFATLLLNCLAPDDPLAGDLEEEYRRGRSRPWYWTQVAFAVVILPVRRTDLHQLFAPQGMVMQSIMIGLISVCVVFTMKMITVVLFDDEIRRLLIGPSVLREAVRVGLSFGVALVAGAAIARLHDVSRAAATVAFSATVTAWAFANLYLLNGHGNLDSALPHVMALLVFITGLLTGGLHLAFMLDGPMRGRHAR